MNATITFNRRISQVVGSATLTITARAKALISEGQDVVNFGGGEPDFDTPDHIKSAAIEAIQKGFTKYTPSIGTLDLRKAISEKFLKDNNLTYAPDQIVVNCGAKHSLFNAIQVLADEGDEVLIPKPYWVSYPEMVKVAGATPRFIETTATAGHKITAAQLAEHITPKSKILILNSPSNPTGMVYDDKELKDIAEVCLSKGIFVISDEIYEKLIYETSGYSSFAALTPEIYDQTITVNGVSKAYAMTGWRIGYCAGPKEIMQCMKRLQDHSTSNPSSISQAAALAAIKSSPESVKAMRDEFKTRRDLMMACIDKIPELSYVRPEGAFYLFCDVSQLGNSMDFAKRVLDDVKVAVIPGEGFGAPGFVRLSFATSQERIQEGIKRIGQWIKDQQK